MAVLNEGDTESDNKWPVWLGSLSPHLWPLPAPRARAQKKYKIQMVTVSWYF